MSLVNQPKYDLSLFSQEIEPNFIISSNPLAQTSKVGFNATLISNEFASSSSNEITINLAGRYKITYNLICYQQDLMTSKSSGVSQLSLYAGSNVVGSSLMNSSGVVNPETWSYSKSYVFSQLTSNAYYFKTAPTKTSDSFAWIYQYTGKIYTSGEYTLSANDKIYLEASVAQSGYNSTVTLRGSGVITIQKLY